MRKKWLFVLIPVLLIVGMLVVYHFETSKTTEGEKKITVQVEHIVGEAKDFTIQTKAEYLREALSERNLIQGSEGAYGLWVETVDGETANESMQQWWGYTVNGKTAVYGVDEQPVKDGDAYVFTLHTGY